MTTRPTRCGSVAGYSQHIRNGDPTCAACRAAWGAYYSEYRRKNPRVRIAAKLRQRALAALAARHPEEFQRLLAVEWAKGGTP